MDRAASVPTPAPPGPGPARLAAYRPMDQPEPFYESFWRSARWGAAEPNEDERSRLAAITDLLTGCDVGERPRILDLGCGRGWLSRALAARGEILGADVTAAAVERARELFPGLRFERADVEGLLASCGEASFDLVVSSEVLEHVGDGDKPAFLRGVHRLLRPGGHAILTTPRGELWPAWQRSRDGDSPSRPGSRRRSSTAWRPPPGSRWCAGRAPTSTGSRRRAACSRRGRFAPWRGPCPPSSG